MGRFERAALMDDCTSLAAPSILRSRSNCSTTSVLERELVDVISDTPAIRPSERSRGVATVAAMVSGPAPGSFARTTTTGKSTCGRGATGKSPKATMPARARARVSRVVATGLRIKGAEILAGNTSGPKRCLRPASRSARRRFMAEILPSASDLGAFSPPCGPLCTAGTGVSVFSRSPFMAGSPPLHHGRHALQPAAPCAP